VSFNVSIGINEPSRTTDETKSLLDTRWWVCRWRWDWKFRRRQE